MSPGKTHLWGRRPDAAGGFTLAELIVVVLIIALFVSITQLNLVAILGKGRLRSSADELAAAMQAAADSSAKTGSRYELTVDIAQQTFTLRQITTPDLSEVLEEEIILVEDLPGGSIVEYVLFDDGEFANEGRAKFRVGPLGWQYGGKIVMVGQDGHRCSVVVTRVASPVMALDGDVEILEPRSQDEMFF